jgi:hypothetical protein
MPKVAKSRIGWVSSQRGHVIVRASSSIRLVCTLSVASFPDGTFAALDAT